MVQFKEVFLGQETRAYTRATSVQRCLRAGGKHNDLDNVGYTARHHTFFEMLGNFSFGDYFKREAIGMAWHFLTEVLDIPAQKLWVTVYQADDEAAEIWLKEVGVDPHRFSRCGEKDNFWMMGDVGPCGPCTEIFYDHGPSVPGGPPGSPDADGDRYIEIWNLVFMQFSRDAEGRLAPLPKPCVDTGMGLERLAAVLQGVRSNYEIDIFRYLLQKAQAAVAFTGVDPMHCSGLRVIADHIRACVFLVADGVVPSNEGRGYVLRRIIRRALRHGRGLGAPDLFFSKLVPAVCDQMGESCLGLTQQSGHIVSVLDQESVQFGRTLDQGLKIFEKALESVKSQAVQTQQIPGEVVFRLYDTYGFPVDLTADLAREHGYGIDQTGFEACMDLQRQRGQASSQFSQLSLEGDQALLGLALKTQFSGYDRLSEPVTVQALLKEGVRVTALCAGEVGLLVTQTTPFYAESGGQVGDQGRLVGSGVDCFVHHTTRLGEMHVHHVEVQAGSLKVDQVLMAQVDPVRRHRTMRNHSATHLLHAALRKQLGEHVTQKGSYVGPDYLRFDFSHPTALDSAALEQLEAAVNTQILNNTPVETELLSREAAVAGGAMALFGEKYDAEVRVLNIGAGYSLELCGGTHVRATGDIGLLVITAQSSVASGVRRIEAVTGDVARLYLQGFQRQIKTMAAFLKTTPEGLDVKLQQLQDHCVALEETLKAHQAKGVQDAELALLGEVKHIGEIAVIAASVEVADDKALRQMVDQLKSRLEKAVIVLARVIDGKISLIVGVSASCTDRLKANLLADQLGQRIGGKGGGRAEMAQAGGRDTVSLPQALAYVAQWVTEQSA
jgi:alanyl-tRNA synthetase